MSTLKTLECDARFAYLPDIEDRCDPNEAPPGFRAVPKGSTPEAKQGVNICRACDWRKQCQKATTEELLTWGNRCMASAVVNGDKIYRRNDRAGVVFKLKGVQS